MSQKVVGLHAFGGSIALVARELGMEVLALLDSRGASIPASEGGRTKFSRSDSIYARVCERIFGQSVVHVDSLRLWSKTVEELKQQEITLLFGQPQFSGAKGMKQLVNPHIISKNEEDGEEVVQDDLIGKDGADFVRLTQELRPSAVVLFGTGMLYTRGSKHLDLMESQLPEYQWSRMTTNAVLHGVPQNRKITVVIGTRGFYFDPTVPKEINADDLPIPWSVLAELFPYEPSEDGRDVDNLTLSDGRVVMSHIVPKRPDAQSGSFARKMLWDASSLLQEGQALFEIEDISAWPEVVRNRAKWVIKESGYRTLVGVQKGQLPVRLHRSIPSPTIGGFERHIHPAADRPLSLREIARLFCLPDDYYLGNYYLPGLKVLGTTIPLPVVRWVFTDIIRSMKQEQPVNSPSSEIPRLFDTHATKALSDRKRRLLGRWVKSYEKK